MNALATELQQKQNIADCMRCLPLRRAFLNDATMVATVFRDRQAAVHSLQRRHADSHLYSPCVAALTQAPSQLYSQPIL